MTYPIHRRSIFDPEELLESFTPIVTDLDDWIIIKGKITSPYIYIYLHHITCKHVLSIKMFKCRCGVEAPDYVKAIYSTMTAGSLYGRNYC